jgi:hypothetical protein
MLGIGSVAPSNVALPLTTLLALLWVRNTCQTEFMQWVQFFLSRQLANAYRQIVDVEMQLVLDFKPVGVIGECFERPEMWSQTTHAIQLAGVDRARLIGIDSHVRDLRWSRWNIGRRSSIEVFGQTGVAVFDSQLGRGTDRNMLKKLNESDVTRFAPPSPKARLHWTKGTQLCGLVSRPLDNVI